MRHSLNHRSLIHRPLPRRLVATAVAALLLLGAAGCSNSTVLIPQPRTQPLEVGVTVFAMWRDWATHDALFDRVRDSGSRWLRVDTGWCTLEEAGEGAVSDWYQSRLDAVVAGATARGLSLLVMTGCAPTWAGGTSYHDYPDDAAQFERVTRYLSQRYRGQVAAWEIWNEPDCIGGCVNGAPEEYVPILQAGFRGIRAGDPQAVIVSGGISGNNADWIDRMYAAGAAGYFDALAVHPYLDPADAPPDAPSDGQVYRLTTVSAVRAVMVRHGDAAKSIWFTEFGWSTPTTGDRSGVGLFTQAEYLGRAMDLIQHYYPYVTHAFWFTIRDRDDSTPYENAFGLLFVDGTPKPAYLALIAANRRLERN